MLHYPKLKIKAYKTCLNFVSNSFISLKLVVKDKNHKTCHLPFLGPWKSALKSFRQDEKISLKKRNLQHPEIGLHSVTKPLLLTSTTPPLPLVEVTILKLPNTRTRPTARTCATAGCPRGLASPRLAPGARCSRRLASLHTACSPPPRGRQVARRRQHTALAPPSRNPLLAAPPKR